MKEYKNKDKQTNKTLGHEQNFLKEQTSPKTVNLKVELSLSCVYRRNSPTKYYLLKLQEQHFKQCSTVVWKELVN